MTSVHVVVPEGVDDPARPSGGNTYDRRLCAELAALGWDVRETVVPAENCRGSARYTASALSEALAHVPTGSTVLVDGLLASDQPEPLRAHVSRLRTVLLVHLPLGMDGSADDRVERRAREASALGCVAAVVTTSRWTRRWLLDVYRLDPSRVTVAVPGVQPAPAAVGEPAGHRLLCVGAVIPAKGHDVLVDALSRLPEPGWGCVCVGSLDRDPSFVDRVRGRALALGVADRVRFTGALAGSALDRAVARADLFVTATRGETYGMAVTEALARGIPVLGTRVGGLPEAMGRAPSGRVPGILVPPGDPDALALALRQWFDHPELRRRLRAAAADRRATLPTWSATAVEVARVLIDAAS